MNGTDKPMRNLLIAFKVIFALVVVYLVGAQYSGQMLPLSAQMVIAYGLGSIPFGLILTKLFAKQDIRSIGSGNIGATNVLRTGNKSLAAATLYLDAAKGVLAILWLTTDHTMAIGLTCLLGHMFPIWLNFKGGKGVATALGILLAVNWVFAASALVIWASLIKLTRMSSLSSLIVVIGLPVSAYLLNDNELAIFTLMMGVLIFIRHIENIKRIIRGKESKVGDRTN